VDALLKAMQTQKVLFIAEENLSKALNLCRQINLVETETDILLDLARLRYDQKTSMKPNHLPMKPCSLLSVAVTSCKARM